MRGALRTGLLLLPSIPVAGLAATARRAEALGYDDLWVADERFFREVYTTLGACAAATTRLRLGTGVTDPFSRHPALTAMAIATLDEVSGGRAVLGLGAGVSGFRELGIDLQGSATAIAEAIDLIRRLLAGETATASGRHLRFDDGRLDFTPGRARLPIYVASQRAAGCRVAGRLGDGAIMQGCVAEPLLRFFRDRSGPRRAGGASERVHRRGPGGRAGRHAARPGAEPGRPAARLLHLRCRGGQPARPASRRGPEAPLHPRPGAAPGAGTAGAG
jgi:5,10-methylenetetrahydromethanopterin reductase